MIRAVIFDFDGVIADTEPLHCDALQRVLRGAGIHLSKADYFTKYIGLTDRALLYRLCADLQQPLDEAEAEQLLKSKDQSYLAMITKGIEPLPGVREFVARAVERWPLAICSGALRVEIETILRGTGLLGLFKIIVSSDEVATSKPDPTGFLHTLGLLRRVIPDLAAGDCLVVEDSVHGMTAAKAAGMPVLAVLSQCSAESLSRADAVVPDLRAVTEAMLAIF
jgi:HAD superfamily hydrolase (TIGR01509 family)